METNTLPARLIAKQIATQVETNASLYWNDAISYEEMHARQSALWLMAERDGLCDQVRPLLAVNSTVSRHLILSIPSQQPTTQR